jgi:hypothetical protein
MADTAEAFPRMRTSEGPPTLGRGTVPKDGGASKERTRAARFLTRTDRERDGGAELRTEETATDEDEEWDDPGEGGDWGVEAQEGEHRHRGHPRLGVRETSEWGGDGGVGRVRGTRDEGRGTLDDGRGTTDHGRSTMAMAAVTVTVPHTAVSTWDLSPVQ